MSIISPSIRKYKRPSCLDLESTDSTEMHIYYSRREDCRSLWITGVTAIDPLSPRPKKIVRQQNTNNFLLCGFIINPLAVFIFLILYVLWVCKNQRNEHIFSLDTSNIIIIYYNNIINNELKFVYVLSSN